MAVNERGSRQAYWEAGKGGLDLVTAAKMWPTPSAEDAKHHGMDLSMAVKVPQWTGIPLESLRETASAVSGSLNPTWVEWLMGYPLGWTACAAWGTPSSRKSRSGSHAVSSPPKDAR